MTWSGAQALPAGDYTLIWSIEIFNTSSEGHAGYRVQINDSITVVEDVADKTGEGQEGAADHVAHGGQYPYSHAGGTINLDFDLNQAGPGTAQIRNMRATFIPCVPVDATTVT